MPSLSVPNDSFSSGDTHVSPINASGLIAVCIHFVGNHYYYYYFLCVASRKLRYQKVYAALPCPLLALKFWRLCIDEAQMVESDSTKLAEMALRINAVHRWCVTGTPVQKSVEGNRLSL